MSARDEGDIDQRLDLSVNEVRSDAFAATAREASSNLTDCSIDDVSQIAQEVIDEAAGDATPGASSGSGHCVMVAGAEGCPTDTARGPKAGGKCTF